MAGGSRAGDADQAREGADITLKPTAVILTRALSFRMMRPFVVALLRVNSATEESLRQGDVLFLTKKDSCAFRSALFNYEINMRAYTLAVASLAIDAPLKWTDNLIAQHPLDDVLSGGRGVARRISHTALVQLALARHLHTELGIAVRDAVRMASGLIANSGALALGDITLSVDMDRLQRRLAERLAVSLESSPSPKRGRPATR